VELYLCSPPYVATVHRHDRYRLFAPLFTWFLKIQIFHFLLPRFKLTSPQTRRVIPVKTQNCIIMYQFLLWPRNDVQMFKPDTNPELSVYKTPTCCLGSLLIFLRETQTDVLVKDGVELWYCVVWTVVRVWECSVSVRILTGEWEGPGGNQQSARLGVSLIANWMIRARTQAPALHDRLRYGRATVVKLCDVGNKQCLHLSSLL